MIPTALHHFLDHLAVSILWADCIDLGLSPDDVHHLLVTNHGVPDTAAIDPQAYIDAVRAIDR